MLRIIGANLKTARHKANMTQECLAELADAHWQTVSSIENGKFPCLVTTFVRITQALGVGADRLFDGLPEPDAKRVQSIKMAMARQRKPKAA